MEEGRLVYIGNPTYDRIVWGDDGRMYKKLEAVQRGFRFVRWKFYESIYGAEPAVVKAYLSEDRFVIVSVYDCAWIGKNDTGVNIPEYNPEA